MNRALKQVIAYAAKLQRDLDQQLSRATGYLLGVAANRPVRTPNSRALGTFSERKRQ